MQFAIEKLSITFSFHYTLPHRPPTTATATHNLFILFLKYYLKIIGRLIVNVLWNEVKLGENFQFWIKKKRLNIFVIKLNVTLCSSIELWLCLTFWKKYYLNLFLDKKKISGRTFLDIKPSSASQRKSQQLEIILDNQK